MSVVLPMAANDLLTINGVDASFVAIAKTAGSTSPPAAWVS